MSYGNFNLKSGSNNSLVEKILEQGQRLRNSMVQAVLNNAPFNTEVLNNYNNSSKDLKDVPAEKCSCDKNKKTYSTKDYERLHKYLRGEEMCMSEEIKALETLRTMSPNKIIQSTSCKNECHYKNSCDICKEYESKIFSESRSSTSSEKSLYLEKPTSGQKHSARNYDTVLKDKLTRSQGDLLKDVQKESSTKLKTVRKTFHENQRFLKYVDSLKVNVYSLKLNSAGNRKIMANEVSSKPFFPSANTYFVEYSLPDILTKHIPKSRAKVNSGLSPDKTVRFCSKKLQGESVYFKQQSIHSLININMIDLSNIKLEFKVSFRSVKQRNAVIIGKAVFNLGYLVTNKFFTGEQDLVILNENAPVVLGNLKVSLQFGCDKLYFGKEFIDAVSCSKENANLSESDSIYKLSDNENLNIKSINTISIPKQSARTEKSSNLPTPKIDPISSTSKSINTNDEKPLLYVLIFISEVRLLTKPLNTYIVSRGFTRDDTITSKVIYKDYKPVFNFYQIIPILLDEEFINRLRDNYIVIEVWEKREDVDVLIGLSKLTVHQLYVAYRNPAIVKHLTKNKHPVIGVDWWEPVSCPTSNSENGQLRALVALGSQTQIEYLEETRNLKCLIERSPPPPPRSIEVIDDHCKVRSCLSLPCKYKRDRVNTREKFVDNYIKSATTQAEEIIFKDDLSMLDVNKRTILVCDKYVQEPDIEISPTVVLADKIVETTDKSEKVDASTQSDLIEMEPERDISTTSNVQVTQRDFLNSFLEQLISAREMSSKNKHVENSTNTDDLIPETTFSAVDNKPTSAVSSNENQNDSNMNKTHVLNTTFPINSIVNNPSSNSNLTVRNTSDLLDSLQKALSINKNEQNKNKVENAEDINNLCDGFKAHVVVENALHLPSRKKCKSKKNKTKNSKNNEEILPSTYVTFKGLNEDNLLVTSVVPKNTNPRWDYRCDIRLPSNLLLNNQKRLIFKVWRKANGPSLQPNFQTDIVLGFAALDLTVLLLGLPNVQGWFNIVDFSSKCNGQIKISVTPLENLSKFNEYKRSYIPENVLETVSSNISSVQQKIPDSEQETIDETVPSEFLSRALKRKFTELDEITQRLRQRLSVVTNDDSDLSNDDFADEFEKDLNTICVETEPFHCTEEIGRNEIATSSKLNSSTNLLTLDTIESNSSTKLSETSTTVSEINVPTVQENLTKLDTHLAEGKLKIDSLLEKLSLLTNDNQKSESFSSRYVSGCSINQEPETSNQVLKDIGLRGNDNIDHDLIFNPVLFQQMFTNSVDSTPRLDSLEYLSSVHCTTLQNLVQDSTSSSSAGDLQSVSSNSLSDNVVRQAPDGAGNISND